MYNVIIFIIGLILGVALLYFIIMQKATGLMIRENESKYSLVETEKLLTERIGQKGWKNPITHDLQMTMKNNGYEVLPVKVYEICKPEYANEILSRDGEKVVSSMMPCRIAVYENSAGKVIISRMNSGLIARPMKGVIPGIMKKSALEVEEILQPLIKPK